MDEIEEIKARLLAQGHCLKVLIDLSGTAAAIHALADAADTVEGEASERGNDPAVIRASAYRAEILSLLEGTSAPPKRLSVRALAARLLRKRTNEDRGRTDPQHDR